MIHTESCSRYQSRAIVRWHTPRGESAVMGIRSPWLFSNMTPWDASRNSVACFSMGVQLDHIIIYTTNFSPVRVVYCQFSLALTHQAPIAHRETKRGVSGEDWLRSGASLYMSTTLLYLENEMTLTLANACKTKTDLLNKLSSGLKRVGTTLGTAAGVHSGYLAIHEISEPAITDCWQLHSTVFVPH